MPGRSSSNGLLLMLALAASGLAQTPLPAQPASVEGKVTNSLTGAPLLRVHITLRGFGPAGTQQTFGAMTDGDGKFSITAMPPGSYAMMAQRVGFVMPAESASLTVRTIVLAAGDKKDGLKLALTPTGAVTGRVLDADGQPITGAGVTAEGGRGSQSGSTDEKGQFRIGGLSPGRYRVKAEPPELPLPPEIRTDGTRDFHNARTYFPNSIDTKGASRVDVPAGGEVGGIDIRLVRTPVVTVSGTVSGFPPSAKNINVQARRTDGGAQGGNQMNPGGAFRIWRLDPGKYTLSASMPGSGFGGQNMQTGPVEIEVAESDIGNIALKVIPPAEIRGQMVFEDEQAKQQPLPPQQGKAAQRPPPPRRLDLRPAFSLYGGGQMQAEIGADDTFTLENVQPQLYRVRLSWSPAYVKSMRLGSTPIDGALLVW